MSKSINYGQLMRNALRQFVADVLSLVARDGLPGKHHFFITFDTSHPGVVMSPSLKARYPAEMTIVLQEWFEDLAVMKDRFSVTLSFGDVPQTIVVPFDAMTTFADPSVEFGVRFDAQDGIWDSGAGDDGDPPSPPTPIKPQGHGDGGSVIDFGSRSKKKT
jgi:hypothetical protein